MALNIMVVELVVYDDVPEVTVLQELQYTKGVWTARRLDVDSPRPAPVILGPGESAHIAFDGTVTKQIGA